MTVQQKIKWGLVYPEVYCPHLDTGKLIFDPKEGTKHFKPWWMLVSCDQGIVDLYRWFLKKYGLPTMPNKLWGPHISVIKHEEPPSKHLWQKLDDEVEFRYSTNIRWDNDCHAWLDVYSPDLSLIRQEMGLRAKEWFHLTLGRLE